LTAKERKKEAVALIQKLEKRGWSARTIAEEIGCDRTSVHRWRDRNDVGPLSPSLTLLRQLEKTGALAKRRIGLTVSEPLVVEIRLSPELTTLIERLLSHRNGDSASSS